MYTYVTCGNWKINIVYRMVVWHSITHQCSGGFINNMYTSRIHWMHQTLRKVANPPNESTRIMLWRCHIAPAKPNGPIPFDLNDKRWNITGQIVVFFICHRAHTDLYRVLPDLVPNSPSSYSYSLSFSPCPHRVYTAYSEICLFVCLLEFNVSLSQ